MTTRVAPCTAVDDAPIAGNPTENTLVRAKELMTGQDERILAIYEPSSSQACPARWQCLVDLALGCPLFIPCCCPMLPCLYATELAHAYDKSFFVITDQNVCECGAPSLSLSHTHTHRATRRRHARVRAQTSTLARLRTRFADKDVEPSCTTESCEEDGCFRSACHACIDLNGSDSGKVPLHEVKEVRSGKAMPGSTYGPGPRILPADHVALELYHRRSLVAAHGQGPSGRKHHRRYLFANVVLILADDLETATPLIQAAVDAAKSRVDPQVIERLANGGAATEKLKWDD
eukprot:7137902-Prymnesium_polylepis.1